MRIDIEAMTPADWEQVRAIYLEGIASGQATFEVDAPPWEQWDAGHHLFDRPQGPLPGSFLVAAITTEPPHALTVALHYLSCESGVGHMGRR
jgi:phosphinothricin acetyltransferase